MSLTSLLHLANTPKITDRQTNQSAPHEASCTTNTTTGNTTSEAKPGVTGGASPAPSKTTTECTITEGGGITESETITASMTLKLGNGDDAESSLRHEHHSSRQPSDSTVEQTNDDFLVNGKSAESVEIEITQSGQSFETSKETLTKDIKSDSFLGANADSGISNSDLRLDVVSQDDVEKKDVASTERLSDDRISNVGGEDHSTINVNNGDLVVKSELNDSLSSVVSENEEPPNSTDKGSQGKLPPVQALSERTLVMEEQSSLIENRENAGTDRQLNCDDFLNSVNQPVFSPAIECMHDFIMQNGDNKALSSPEDIQSSDLTNKQNIASNDHSISTENHVTSASVKVNFAHVTNESESTVEPKLNISLADDLLNAKVGETASDESVERQQQQKQIQFKTSARFSRHFSSSDSDDEYPVKNQASNRNSLALTLERGGDQAGNGLHSPTDGTLSTSRDTTNVVHVVKLASRHTRQGSNVSIASLTERCREIQGEAVEHHTPVKPPLKTARGGRDDSLEGNLQPHTEPLTVATRSDSEDEDGKLYPISPFPPPQSAQDSRLAVDGVVDGASASRKHAGIYFLFFFSLDTTLFFLDIYHLLILFLFRFTHVLNYSCSTFGCLLFHPSSGTNIMNILMGVLHKVHGSRHIRP